MVFYTTRGAPYSNTNKIIIIKGREKESVKEISDIVKINPSITCTKYSVFAYVFVAASFRTSGKVFNPGNFV